MAQHHSGDQQLFSQVLSLQLPDEISSRYQPGHRDVFAKIIIVNRINGAVQSREALFYLMDLPAQEICRRLASSQADTAANTVVLPFFQRVGQLLPQQG